MAWTTPLTAVANAALTAAQWNASVRDNLNETATAKFTGAGQYFVATAGNAGAARIAATDFYATGTGTDTTNSTTYTGLTGGPAPVATTGTSAIVMLWARMFNNTAGGRSVAGFAVSGATTLAATDLRAIAATSNAANEEYWMSGAFLLNASTAALTAGSNTFTMQLRVTTGTGTFAPRSLVVLPF